MDLLGKNNLHFDTFTGVSAMLEGVFVQGFSNINDPGVDRTKKHLFLDIIGLPLFAVFSNAQCYTKIEDFCRHHHAYDQDDGDMLLLSWTVIILPSCG